MPASNRIDRRTFAAQALFGAAGLAFGASTEPAKARYLGTSCQTYIFEQFHGRQNDKPDAHLDEMLGVIHNAGYDGLETMARFIDSPERIDSFGALLEKHKLRLTGIYSGARLHEPEPAKKAIESLTHIAQCFRKLACTVLVTNPDPIGREKTDAELDVQAEYLNKVGQSLKEAGASIHVHCHAPELRSNGREFKWNLDKTDPALVFLNADVNWILKGGCDPYELLEKYWDRTGSNHLRNSVNGVWTEAFGEGDTDYRKIKAIFDKSPRPQWLTVELAYEAGTKETRSLPENLAASRRYVKEVFGV